MKRELYCGFTFDHKKGSSSTRMRDSSPTPDEKAGGIIRVHKRDIWFSADKRPFNNSHMSWETRGLLAYLLTKPDGWQIRFWDLVRQGNAKRYRLRRMLSELENWGHLVRYRTRTDDGQYDWVSNLYEDPIPVLRTREHMALKEHHENKLAIIREQLAFFGEAPRDTYEPDQLLVSNLSTMYTQRSADDDFADLFPKEQESEDDIAPPPNADEARARVARALVAFGESNGAQSGVADPHAGQREVSTERVAEHIASLIPTSLPTEEARWARGWATPIGEMLGACENDPAKLIDLIDQAWEDSEWLRDKATTARYFVNDVLRLAQKASRQEKTANEPSIEPDLTVAAEDWV